LNKHHETIQYRHAVFSGNIPEHTWRVADYINKMAQKLVDQKDLKIVMKK